MAAETPLAASTAGRCAGLPVVTSWMKNRRQGPRRLVVLSRARPWAVPQPDSHSAHVATSRYQPSRPPHASIRRSAQPKHRLACGAGDADLAALSSKVAGSLLSWQTCGSCLTDSRRSSGCFPTAKCRVSRGAFPADGAAGLSRAGWQIRGGAPRTRPVQFARCAQRPPQRG
jgi:hypothetical protein